MLRVLINPRVLAVVALVGVLLAVALWPSTVAVETAAVIKGPLVVTVDEEGRTRVRDKYALSAPVSGRVERIDLEPGDAVTRGQVVARVRPEAAPLLDARTRVEAQATVEAARGSLAGAQAEEARARTTLDQARRELKRGEELVAGGVIAQNEVDMRRDAVQSAEDALMAAVSGVSVARADLQRAEARLRPQATGRGGAPVSVAAPVDGVILSRARQSEGVVPAGAPLLEIGDPSRLEIVADLLSTDAVKVQTGARAIVERWGGSAALEARVRRVEPAGFTKVSALGVEEQRVNVILDFTDPSAAWAALGDAYRVEVRIVIWEAGEALKVPTGALFREGQQWAVYAVREGRAARTPVEIGQQTGEEAEVLSGLSEGERVVMHPGDTLADGSLVEERVPGSR